MKNQIAKTFGEKTSVKELSSAGGGYRRGGEEARDGAEKAAGGVGVGRYRLRRTAKAGRVSR